MTPAEIGAELRGQDNRATAAPIFIVQKLRRVYGFDPQWGGDVVWMFDHDEVDAEEAVQLEAQFEAGEEEPDGYTRTCYQDTWEFVTACFTEAGAKAYIQAEGHNLKQPRIYAHGSYRNEEWRAVRDLLLSL